jgi:Ni,Fe-hydrogenase maturation factor
VTGAGVLVVGYGNSLRGDDGVGWHAAGRLAADPGLAEALYGEAPPVVLVGVGAGSLATGDRLSDALERALPELVEVVLAVAGGGRRPPPHPPSV